MRKKLAERRKEHRQPTLEEGVELFVRVKKAEGVRERSVKDYREHYRYLNEFLTFYLRKDPVHVTDVTPEAIRSYIRYLLYHRKPRHEGQRRGLSPSTVNIRLRTLKTMCAYWNREGYAAQNAMENIKPVRDDRGEESRGLTREELRKIFDGLNDKYFGHWRDRVLMYLLLDTGLRINEAVYLKKAHVNFTHHEILVPSEAAKNRSYRSVPVSSEVLTLIRKLIEETEFHFGESEAVFRNGFGEQFTADAFRRRCIRLRDKIGIEKLSPHMFRHTFAREYLKAGGDLFTLQRILDHASITTTKTYVSPDMEYIRSQHAKATPLQRYL
ncbi:tyrosine-type recombinase/integrase [Salimicrobium humidisoli]|uniref:Integrase/recombinase XerD n=1 Tax=Salimicrobium humidisoli TaxID=2029857 RepID=A0ABX4HRC1_9BACI|nr:tyrosine-type recombinase/integrase [Salimicrobium humidisoli]PBB05751.1 hypothetical protein CKW00_07050 [Salimicrobium humidisoli]